ncbi:MAG: dipeptide ABC transporter ATP-binding protein [Corynebacterium sp.]|uniref:dipeptide ABC transporter ATP-binding protein n=1 Tax=Corynebacterium sp. TaxID=1720 RepID=UPI003F91E46C
MTEDNTTGDAPLVDIRDLHVSFGGHEVVRGVSLSVHRGETLAVVGESGSGKSVSVRSLLGLAGPGAQVSAGRLEFDGADVRGFGARRWRRIRGGRIGLVLQDALVALDPLRTVGAEIGEALDTHHRGRARLSRQARRDRTLELLDLVGVPGPALRAGQRPDELSGGLRQRALIASALANRPDLIVADEPTTALDATVQAQVLDVLKAATDDGTALILISHDLSVVARLADRVAVVRHGEVVEEGPAAEVLADPRHSYTRSLLAAVPTAGSRGRLLTSGEPVPFGRPAPVGEPVVRATGLVKSFRGRRRRGGAAASGASAVPAVRDVSFELHRGRTLGIVGESGSGKSTTARIVLGLTDPDEGSVEFLGRHVSVIYQDPLSSFDPRWSVGRILLDAVSTTGLTGGPAQARVTELLDQVGLSDDFRPSRPLRLSGGQRQRVAIARALASDPDVIVCDEPVSALDVSVQARILDLLTTLQAETGVALLFISHDLGVIHHVSDDIIVMRDGEVVESGTADQVFDGPRHPYTRTLLAAVPAVPAVPSVPAVPAVSVR